jgi:hypothetical protein
MTTDYLAAFILAVLPAKLRGTLWWNTTNGSVRVVPTTASACTTTFFWISERQPQQSLTEVSSNLLSLIHLCQHLANTFLLHRLPSHFSCGRQALCRYPLSLLVMSVNYDDCAVRKDAGGQRMLEMKQQCADSSDCARESNYRYI